MSKILRNESEMFYRNHTAISKKERETSERFDMQTKSIKEKISKKFDEEGEDAALDFAKTFKVFSQDILCREDLIALFEEVKEEREKIKNTENNTNENISNISVENQTSITQKIEVKRTRNNLIYLTSEELIDYDDQSFSTDNEEENEELIKSIKQNGIIEPIVVKKCIKEKGKYQILSGHRLKKCGLKAGLEKFPCIIIDKDDNEVEYFREENEYLKDTVTIMTSIIATIYKMEGNNPIICNIINKLVDNFTLEKKIFNEILKNPKKNMVLNDYICDDNKKLEIFSDEELYYLYGEPNSNENNHNQDSESL